MKNMKRTIAIVCGGDSSEHDVSLRSAQGLYSFFDKERFDVYIVDIKGQDWHVELHDGTTAKIDRNDFSFVEEGKAKLFDYAYITIHGTPGENGLSALQYQWRIGGGHDFRQVRAQSVSAQLWCQRGRLSADP